MNRQPDPTIPVPARRSLRWRLPLSISALIALVLASFLWAAYRQVEITLVRAGGDRARSAAGQLAGLLERSITQSGEDLRRITADRDLQQLLLNPSDATRESARKRLAPRATTRRIEVWRSDGERMLEIAPTDPTRAWLPRGISVPAKAGIADLQSGAGGAFSDVVAEIVTPPSPEARRLGYLLVRSTVSVNPPGVLARMVGPDAAIAIGSKTGGVWTDLSSVVPVPPVNLSVSDVQEYRARDGDRRVGAMVEIRGAPWVVWVEFPHAVVIAPAQAFLSRMLVIGAFVVVVAALLVRAVTGRLTSPLIELTTAAETIAAGDYARRVTVDRADEVGRLARAFNVMGAEIERDVSERQRSDVERRHLEDQLRQAQKMEAIGRLAGGVAHDFNNLLTAILGYCTFASDELDTAHPVRRHIDEIQKAGESAASLTRQLLAFSRRQVLQPQLLDLNSVVSHVDALLRRLIGEDIQLASRLAQPLDTVSVDPGQVEQILMNLAVNARDAMSCGGLLTIETANITLDETYVATHPGASVGPHVMLAVSDNGTGMSAETMAHVFEPFFTTKGRGEGTGLGLATVYGIVKQSGGSIWVYSEPGRGTSFKVYFPRATSLNALPAAASRPPGAGGSETILIAEDQAEVRGLATRILTRQGYTVLAARSGAEALRIVSDSHQPIHLLVTDVIMPVMSGRELVAQLQQSHPEIRILYASGYTDDAIVRHGVLDPGVAFLQKPFTPKSLLAKVREVLDAPVPVGRV